MPAAGRARWPMTGTAVAVADDSAALLGARLPPRLKEFTLLPLTDVLDDAAAAAAAAAGAPEAAC